MWKWTTFLTALAVLVVAVGLSGCTPATDENGDGNGDSETTAPKEGSEAQTGEGDSEVQAEQAEQAERSEADQAAAEKQRICPVSGGALGSMGAPVKVTVTAGDGTEHEVFLCCGGCKGDIEKDPDTYLAKLEQ